MALLAILATAIYFLVAVVFPMAAALSELDDVDAVLASDVNAIDE